MELTRQEALTVRDRRYRRNLAAALVVVAVLDPFGGTGGLLSKAAAVVRPATAPTPTQQDLRGAPGDPGAPSCRGVDRFLEAIVVNVGVDRGGSDVGVAGELADDVDRDAGVRQVRAEGVAQHVRRAATLGQAGGRGVPRDDPRDVADGQRPRGLAGARQGDEQLVMGTRRPSADPVRECVEGGVLERDAAPAPALARGAR